MDYLQEQLKILWKIQKLDLQYHSSPETAAQSAEEKATLTALLPGILIRQYQRIRLARNGVGIASPKGSRCSACNMALPTQLYNEIMRQEDIHSCPSCLRLLIPQGTEDVATGGTP